MAGELTQFVWYVPERGYRLIDAHEIPRKHGDTPRPYLAPVADNRDACPVYRYDPLLAHTGLFKTFAATDPTPESIVAFANKYGWLGVGTSFDAGEPLHVWTNQILVLRSLVELWEMAEKEDTKALRQRVIWHGKDAVEYKYASSPQRKKGVAFIDVGAWIASREIKPDVFERLKAGDVVGPAYYYLQREINQALKDKVSPAMLWDKGRLGLYEVPVSLLGAIWLQFAQAIDTRPEYRKCPECRTWFAVSLDANRKSRRYCSDACRAKAYRIRKQEKPK